MELRHRPLLWVALSLCPLPASSGKASLRRQVHRVHDPKEGAPNDPSELHMRILAPTIHFWTMKGRFEMLYPIEQRFLASPIQAPLHQQKKYWFDKAHYSSHAGT